MRGSCWVAITCLVGLAVASFVTRERPAGEVVVSLPEGASDVGSAPVAPLSAAEPPALVQGPGAEAGPPDVELVVLDERSRPLPQLDVEVFEASEDDDEARDCDDPDHLAIHLTRWKVRRALDVVFRGRTDARGTLVIPDGAVAVDEVLVRSADGRWLGRRAATLPGKVVLSRLQPGPWRVMLRSNVVEPVPDASLALFSPTTGQLLEGATNARGEFELAPCPGCIAVVSAPGFVARAAELDSNETHIHLQRPGRVEVHAPWAPDGLLVKLLLTHERRALVRAGVATFDAVPSVRTALTAHVGRVEHHQHIQIIAGQTVSATLPEWKAATVSVSIATAEGEPVDEATLEVVPRAGDLSGLSYTTLTDVPGERLAIEDVPEGHALVRVSSPGFRSSQRVVVLRPGTNELEVELERMESTHGVIVDDTGRPVAGATISAGDRSVTADADGRFVAQGTEDGTFFITAPGFEAWFGELEPERPQRIRLSRVIPVRLVVTDAAGLPIESHEVELLPGHEPGRVVRCVVDQGQCEPSLVPGADYLVVEPSASPRTVRIAREGEVVRLVLPVPSGGVPALDEVGTRRRTIITFSREANEAHERR
jgi:hypothetical protein